MGFRSRWLVLALAVALGVTATAQAGPMTSYTKQAFAEAQNAGKPIVVFVHASW